MRKQDVVECLQNFLQKHWDDRNFVRLPDDEDFIIVGLKDFQINDESLYTQNDSIWHFNGTVTTTKTDHRESVTTEESSIFAANAVIESYPNQVSKVSPEGNEVDELPEVKIIRLITLTKKI